MNKFSLKTYVKLIPFVAIALLGVFFVGMPQAFSQNKEEVWRTTALAPHTRLAVYFVHDEHNEKAGLDNCAVCHHDATEDGQMTMESSSEGIPCVDCHAVNATKGTPLQRAFHRQCIGCHETQAKGPTACGGCHAVE